MVPGLLRPRLLQQVGAPFGAVVALPFACLSGPNSNVEHCVRNRSSANLGASPNCYSRLMWFAPVSFAKLSCSVEGEQALSVNASCPRSSSQTRWDCRIRFRSRSRSVDISTLWWRLGLRCGPLPLSWHVNYNHTIRSSPSRKQCQTTDSKTSVSGLRCTSRERWGTS